MAAPKAAFSPHPFGMHDYLIECLPHRTPRQVHIGASAAVPLRVGDHYTIDRSEGVYDLVVEQVSHSTEGRWKARCRVFQLTGS